MTSITQNPPRRKPPAPKPVPKPAPAEPAPLAAELPAVRTEAQLQGMPANSVKMLLMIADARGEVKLYTVRQAPAGVAAAAWKVEDMSGDGSSYTLSDLSWMGIPMSCTCKGYTMHKAPRTPCKHIKAFLAVKGMLFTAKGGAL